MIDFLSDAVLPASLIRLGQEALVLLLLATGFRLADIAILAFPPVFSSDSVRIRFLRPRKPDVRCRLSTHVDIRSFAQERVCPVRALSRFVRFSTSLRKPSAVGLFISSTGSDASVDTLRRWAKELLFECGIFASAGSFRSATTSAAFLKNVRVDEIMRMAGWRSESVFRLHYCRPVRDSLNLMESWVQRL